MATFTQAERHQAYTEFTQTFTDGTADVVMRGLRLDDDGQLVTKADLRVAAFELRAEMADLRTELVGAMGTLRTDFVGATADLRTDLVGAMGTLRTDLVGAIGALEIRSIERQRKSDFRLATLMVMILIAVIGALATMRFTA